jgi:hypothetical protein
MKKLLFTTIVGVLVAVGARANTYTDDNQADVWLNAFNPSYTGQFVLAGYNPAAETITSASATFTFWDNSFQLDQGETFTVNMGGDILSNGSFAKTLVLGENVVNAWGILDSTGVLSYTVSLTSGPLTEFWLTDANLTANTAARGGQDSIGRSATVPDSAATLLLLGLGMIGIVSAKRRFSLPA